MGKLPQKILDTFEKRLNAPVVTTVSDDGVTNSIYASCVSIFDGEMILIANNYFDKTLKNLEGSCKGGFLYLTEDTGAYQLKGTYEHYTSGKYFDDMKKWNPAKLPGVGVAVLTVEEVYSGAEKLKL